MPPMRTAADTHHGLLTSMFAVALVFLSPVAGCPGSPAWGTHCSAKLTVNVQQTCSDFTKEVASRVAGVGGWSDPHNSGKYTITGRSDSKLQLQRRTGDEKYTDKMDLGLATTAGGGCTVTACSESQVASYLDKSTNYCNLRNLSVFADMVPVGALKRTGVGTPAAVRSGWQGAEAGPPILDSILTWRACRCEVYTLET